MQITLIINIVLLFVNFILIYYAKKIKIQRTEQRNKILQEIELLKIQCGNWKNIITIKTQELNTLLDKTKQVSQEIFLLKKQQEKEQKLLIFKKQESNDLLEQINKIKEILKKEQTSINNRYKEIQQQAIEAFNKYVDTIDENYKKEEEKYLIKIKQIQKKQQIAQQQLVQIKNIYQAATAARLRQQEDQTKKMFYKIQISEKQIKDIKQLEEWKNNLNDPTVVSKIIWSSYILKPTTDLCNRVLGSLVTCGIYKITNDLTKEIYIGQSVNIADRWKQHIKCGLGIDASSTNKLYNNMQNNGVWNFTFELLQKCSRDKLNQQEKFWIEMYNSNKIGLNIQKGTGDNK